MDADLPARFAQQHVDQEAARVGFVVVVVVRHRDVGGLGPGQPGAQRGEFGVDLRQRLLAPGEGRSAERRAGRESVSKERAWWAQDHVTKRKRLWWQTSE